MGGWQDEPENNYNGFFLYGGNEAAKDHSNLSAEWGSAIAGCIVDIFFVASYLLIQFFFVGSYLLIHFVCFYCF